MGCQYPRGDAGDRPGSAEQEDGEMPSGCRLRHGAPAVQRDALRGVEEPEVRGITCAVTGELRSDNPGFRGEDCDVESAERRNEPKPRLAQLLESFEPRRAVVQVQRV